MAYHSDNIVVEEEQQQQLQQLQQGKKKKMFSGGRRGLGRKGQQQQQQEQGGISKSTSFPSLISSKTSLSRGLSFSSRSRRGSVTETTRASKSDCHPRRQQEITIVDPVYIGPPEEEDDQLEPITLICDGTGNKCILTGVHENLDTCATTNIIPAGTSFRRRSSQQHHQEQEEIVDNKQKDNEKKRIKSKRSQRLWKKISTSYKSLRAFDTGTNSSTTANNGQMLDDMASTKIGSSVMENSEKQNSNDKDMMNELDIVQHLNESFCLVVNSTMFYHSEQCSSSLSRSGSSSTY